MLPAYLWHKVFRYLLLPPGSSYPETPLVRGRRKFPWYLATTEQPITDRNLPVRFVDPDFSAAGQHWKNARSYGSGWALLCCAMASKRLLALVLSFSAYHPIFQPTSIHILSFNPSPQANHPIAYVCNELHPRWIKSAHHPIELVYNELHPQWIKSVEFFLRQRHRLSSLSLTYTDKEQLENLDSPLRQPFTSLTSLSHKLRICVDKSDRFDDDPYKDYKDEEDEDSWTHSLNCPGLQRLKLGRGKWSLQEGWAERFKSLRSLTLKHMDWSYVDLKYLGTVTPRLTEFVLYHSWDLDPRTSGLGVGGTFAFDLSKAQTVRFYFPHSSLTLSLTLSHSLTIFSAMAKQLVLSCNSTKPLTLQHLLLYGQKRLVISSFRLASVRVAYLNGPPKDHHSRNDEYSSYLDSPALSPERSPEISAFSWAEWPAPIAPTVEVLIVRHGVPVEGVDAEWSSLRSLGIVVEREERFEVDLKVERRRDDGEEVTVEDFQERNQRFLQQQQQQQQRWRQEEEEEQQEGQQQERRPPFILAPNLQAIFFPTHACEQQTLASLRKLCPSLALYCISRRSFYWEKQRKQLPETPVVHVRKARSGVPCACFAERRPKNVREKMHSVNRKLVDGYSVDKEEAYMAGVDGGVSDAAGVGGQEEEERWGREKQGQKKEMGKVGMTQGIRRRPLSIYSSGSLLALLPPVPACARPCPLPTDAMGGPADGLGLGAEVNGGAESVADLLALPPDALPRSDLFFRLARAHFRAAVSASAGGPTNPADPASSPAGGANDTAGGGDINDNSSDEALALDVVRNAIQPSERPDHVPSLILASVICARRDTWSEEGVRYGERAVELAASSGPQRAKALHALGVNLLLHSRNHYISAARRDQSLKRAVESLTQASEEDATSAAIMVDLALALAEQRHVSEALKVAKRALKAGGGQWLLAWQLLALLLTCQQRFKDAEDMCRGGSVTEAVVWQCLAEAYLAGGRAADADLCVAKCQTLDPYSADTWMVAGMLEEARGCPEEALACYRSALAIDQWHAASKARLGALLLQMGGEWLHMAQVYLREVVSGDGFDARVWHVLGLVERGRGDVGAAAECFRRAMEAEETAPAVPFNTLRPILPQLLL
ncbi:unnamed protein product [Closterium sp. NIES-65]|nr:unnamed protein product [Closterium sp. NIES-65]